MHQDWIFHDHYIIHVPCKKKAFRFLGTHGKIWCNKCSARFPEELESMANFIYDLEEIEPLRFYTPPLNFTLSYFYNMFPGLMNLRNTVNKITINGK